MNKKTMKIISFITILLCVVMTVSAVCFAAEVDITKIDGKSDGVDSNNMTTVGNKIATIIRNVGIILAVVILMILGIKYMMGSAEEKAEYKKTMIPYIVGAVLLFGAAGIAQVVKTTAGSITTIEATQDQETTEQKKK